MEGPLPKTKMFIKAARVVEGLSKITETTIDFMCHNRNLPLEDLVGQSHKIKMQKGEEGAEQWREFVGTCIEASAIGVHEGYSFYSLEIRPWIWFLTKTSNNRIFQNLKATEIITKIFQDRGFSEYSWKVMRQLEKRVYTVQYNESDYDFICRLMEEEGIYFYSTSKDGKDHLVLADDISGHSPVPDFATIEYWPREQSFRRTTDHIFEWRGGEGVRSGKVTFRDYNFEKPSADMTAATAIAQGKHGHKNYEQFVYPGHYRDPRVGTLHSRIRMEAEACKGAMRSGVGNVRTLATGSTFKLSNNPASAENKDYLIVSATHMMQIEVQQKDETQEMVGQAGGKQDAPDLPGTIKFDEKNSDAYRCTFQTIPKTVPFRAPLTTQWPKIPGILLAKVTGPAGEEIYTDQHYRIKVQFPWDREGKNDENTTCWVRCVSQWSGKDWGLVSVPRIGQEVVIQFEDGDPDRPICTGMLYNAETMVPNALPGNMTQTGIKTRSSKGGGADNYNELVFEDKKGEEFIRMHAEKDYKLTVENDWIVSVGETKKSPGSVTTVIHKDRTETIKTGDLTLTVESGNETRDIKTNRTETVGADAKQTVKGNKNTSVTGNAETSVTGTTKHSSTGAMTIECPQSITIKCGGSSIELTPAGVTIKAAMIKTDATGMAEHSGGGMMTIKGGIVMIN
jgi:type VI secretion system secreted protein VgrG